MLSPTRRGGCGDGGDSGRLQHTGWSPIPSEDAYLRAVGLGHMAQHEERDVEEQGPNWGCFG